MEFQLSRDKYSIIITVLLFAFALAGIIITQFHTASFDVRTNWAMSFSSLLILLICFILYVFKPLKYKIENGNIRISRLAADKVILKEDITTVRIPSANEIIWPIRTFGNGGIFGYTGRYYTKSIGSMIWFCSRKGNYILIERKNKLPVVISPDEPNMFLRAYTS